MLILTNSDDFMLKRLFQLPLNSKDSFFIFGPRGTGKTSWLKTHLQAGSYIYIDLLEMKYKVLV